MPGTDTLTRLRQALTDRYTVERELGRGGMAAVFLARDLRHDRPVALKVLHPELAAGIGTDRFEREIRFAARLQHPHILPVHDSGGVPGGPGEPPLLWFTMPYVEGESLRERIARERQLPLGDAIRIAREVADALDYAHRQGVIHRDIKPENILLTEAHALVADFGVARALTGSTGELPALTGTGLAIGTPAYMSPEQASGAQGLDARSDVYSLGCVLYEMLAGEPPFTGPTAQVIITRLLTEEPRRLRSVRSAVPAAVEQAVAVALAQVPADRFGSAAEFSRALETAVTQPTGSTAPAAPPRRRRRAPLGVALLLGFLLGVGALFAWRMNRTGGSDAGGFLLAVLPFENLGDSADAYFADGMTDELRGRLTGRPGVQVIARASSSQYRPGGKPLREVAEELGVRYLLTGTVRRATSAGQIRVLVRPELVEVVRGGATVSQWQKPYDVPLTSVFEVQALIASGVENALQGEGMRADTVMLDRATIGAPTSNLAAYDEFLRGSKVYFGSSGSASLRQAAGHYEQAVALDSAFAPAWARLAMARSSLYFNTDPSREMEEAAQFAAGRALALAPRLAESHLAMGNYFTLVRGDYAQAVRAYSAGLALAPDHAELLGAIGLAEQGLGRVDDALTHMRRGLALDPRSLLYTRRLVRLLTYTRRFDEARVLADRARGLSPTDGAAILYQALVELSRGDLAAARAVARSIPKDANEPGVLAFFSFDWSAVAILDDAQQQLVLRLPLSLYADNRGVWGLDLARTAMVRGDTLRARAYADSARPTLERLVRENAGDATNHLGLGIALAVLSQRAEAVREGELAVAMRAGDGFTGPNMRIGLVRIYQLVGEPEKAIAQLEELLRIPSYISPGLLRIDPTLASLRQHPRFQALLARP